MKPWAADGSTRAILYALGRMAETGSAWRLVEDINRCERDLRGAFPEIGGFSSIRMWPRDGRPQGPRGSLPVCTGSLRRLSSRWSRASTGWRRSIRGPA